MNTMRAVLIDPENKTVSEIQTKGNIRDTKAILQCRSFTTGAWLRGTVSKGFDAIMVSDDELDERDDPRFWFQVDADHSHGPKLCFVQFAGLSRITRAPCIIIVRR
jgi:hypothetical protein